VLRTKTSILALVLGLSSFAWHEPGKIACAKEKSSQPSRISQGRSLFNANGCLDCHALNKKGCADGVVLDDVGKRRSKKFLQEHLRNPEEHVKQNKSAFQGDPSVMPNPNLSEKEIQLIVDYLVSLKR
jgi:cytochrome c2